MWHSAFSFECCVNLNLVGNCPLQREHMIVRCVLVSTSRGACIVRVNLLPARISFLRNQMYFLGITCNDLLDINISCDISRFPVYYAVIQWAISVKLG